jgi:hypothetical protein
VVAKVVRDRLMARLAARYPGYGWEHNAGYATAEHRAALRILGVTPYHRRSFAPVREALAGVEQLDLQLDELGEIQGGDAGVRGRSAGCCPAEPESTEPDRRALLSRTGINATISGRQRVRSGG